MADPRSSSTQRSFLSFSRLKELTKGKWPDLLIEDYQSIQEDFTFTADEIDTLDARILALQESQHPNTSAQVQFIQQQLDGLPEFTMESTGFTMDQTEFTMDKVLA